MTNSEGLGIEQSINSNEIEVDTSNRRPNSAECHTARCGGEQTRSQPEEPTDHEAEGAMRYVMSRGDRR